MKIKLVSSSSGSHGGGEFYLLSLADGLREVGHDVEVWLSNHEQMTVLADEFTSRKHSVRRIEYRNTYHRRFRSIGACLDRRTQLRLAREFNASGAEIVHLNQQCLEDGLDLVLAAGRCNVPAVSTIHVTRTAKSLGARGAFLRDKVAHRVLSGSRIPFIGVSPNSAQGLWEFLRNPHDNAPFESSRVFAVSNGVSAPKSNERAALRQSLGLKPEEFVIGVIARIEDQKNPLFMCRLLSALPTNVHCIWVGDGRLRQDLETSITANHLQHRITLTGWQSEASRYLSAFDCFCLPSKYEGLPLALLESMAASLPSIVSHVDGTEDAIDHERTGFLCKVDDIDDWRNRVIALVESQTLREQIGHAARRRYESEFSIEAMTNRTVAVYEQVIQNFHNSNLEPRT